MFVFTLKEHVFTAFGCVFLGETNAAAAVLYRIIASAYVVLFLAFCAL